MALGQGAPTQEARKCRQSDDGEEDAAPAEGRRPFRLLLCAAPTYLARFGIPKNPRDLAGHRNIGFRYPNSGKVQVWPLRGAGQEAQPDIRHVILCNTMETLHGAVLSGLGIGCMPDFLAATALRAGSLMPVLLDHLDAPGQFNLIWPSSPHLSPKVRVTVDFMAERLFSNDCHVPCPAQLDRSGN